VCMPIFNFGSTNIDIIFKVDHIVLPGETISSSSLTRSTGGKGANQSVGASHAGEAKVYHVGKIGPDGTFIRSILEEKKVDTTFLREGTTPTGQALIQVSKQGQNSIVLYGGGNKEFTHQEIEETLTHAEEGDWVLLQNEINELDTIIRKCKAKGMHICFNPAPFDDSVTSLPLELLDVLVLNEVEAEGLTSTKDPYTSIDILTKKYKKCQILITLGKYGVMHKEGDSPITTFGIWDVPVIDTTAAGDCFIGTYIARISLRDNVEDALKKASAASSVTVMREGAIPSIPSPDETTILSNYTYIPFSLRNQE
jgi:ribokinase